MWKISIHSLPTVIFFSILLIPLISCREKLREFPSAYYQAKDNFQSIDKHKAERIVSLAPNLTEIVYALGGEKALVGVTRYCDYPDAARFIEKVGGFIDPNIEKIFALKPDLVLAVKNSGNFERVRYLESIGLRVLWVDLVQADDIFLVLEYVGTLLDQKEKAHAMISDMKDDLNRLSQAMKTYRKPLVLVVVGHRPIIVAGPATYIGQLIELAGATHVTAALGAPYPLVSVEYIIQSNPDIIIDISSESEGFSMSAFEDFWSSFSSVTAVKQKRVYHLTERYLQRPSPRMIAALKDLISVIHPEMKTSEPESIFPSEGER